MMAGGGENLDLSVEEQLAQLRQQLEEASDERAIDRLRIDNYTSITH